MAILTIKRRRISSSSGREKYIGCMCLSHFLFLLRLKVTISPPQGKCIIHIIKEEAFTFESANIIRSTYAIRDDDSNDVFCLVVVVFFALL